MIIVGAIFFPIITIVLAIIIWLLFCILRELQRPAVSSYCP